MLSITSFYNVSTKIKKYRTGQTRLFGLFLAQVFTDDPIELITHNFFPRIITAKPDFIGD